MRLREYLETAVREVELVVRESPASKDVNTEAEKATPLETVTLQRLMNTQRIEKT
jgi:hypothetical protein